jgi:hypothetical protein
MAVVPSIKGSIFVRAVEDVLKLVSAGQLSQVELRRRLTPGDLQILDEPILGSEWYDVQVYGRLVELLRDVEGGGQNEYLRKRGVRSAEALIQAGLYQQMEYLNRTQLARQSDPESRFRAFGRDLRLLTSLQGSILNFTRQTPQVDPEHSDRYLLEFSEAIAYPEVLCWTTEGFINRMAAQHDSPDLWRWERPRPDVILYRMRRSL